MEAQEPESCCVSCQSNQGNEGQHFWNQVFPVTNGSKVLLTSIGWCGFSPPGCDSWLHAPSLSSGAPGGKTKLKHWVYELWFSGLSCYVGITVSVLKRRKIEVCRDEVMYQELGILKCGFKSSTHHLNSLNSVLNLIPLNDMEIYYNANTLHSMG